MVKRKKRPRDAELEVFSTNRVHLTPLYSKSQTDASATTGDSSTVVTLSLPLTLGRRNLAETWWANCPRRCNAVETKSIPCKRYCFPVRRKSHRELLSRKIVAIDATGQVEIIGQHPQLVQWTGKLDTGGSCRLAIGNPNEAPWMLFSLQFVRAVTPPKPVWLHTSERRRQIGVRTRAFLLDEDSPSKRALFGHPPTEDDWLADKDDSLKEAARPGPESSGQQDDIVWGELKPPPQPWQEQPCSQELNVDPDASVCDHSMAHKDPAPEVASVCQEGTVPAENGVIMQPVRTQAASENESALISRMTLVSPPKGVESHALEEPSPSLFQSTQQPEMLVPTRKTVRRRLDFHVHDAGDQSTPHSMRKLGGAMPPESYLDGNGSPSQSLSLPMGQESSSDESEQSMQEATEPCWKAKRDSIPLVQLPPRLCSELQLSDWKRIQATAMQGSFSRAVADMVIARHQDAGLLPSILDGCELEKI